MSLKKDLLRDILTEIQQLRKEVEQLQIKQNTVPFPYIPNPWPIPAPPFIPGVPYTPPIIPFIPRGTGTITVKPPYPEMYPWSPSTITGPNTWDTFTYRYVDNYATYTGDKSHVPGYGTIISNTCESVVGKS